MLAPPLPHSGAPRVGNPRCPREVPAQPSQKALRAPVVSESCWGPLQKCTDTQNADEAALVFSPSHTQAGTLQLGSKIYIIYQKIVLIYRKTFQSSEASAPYLHSQSH